jgi:heterodisulfide reductase subunit A-like polyferredoxin
MYGLDFLARVNLGERVRVGARVAVVGGGNVAMDAARAALRLGAEQVTVVYRRGRAEMPALPEELEQAEEEGVRLELLANPVRVLSGPKQRVTGLECLRMKLGRRDASGRRKPVPIEGSNFELPADTVIIAIGQVADLEGFALVDGKLRTDGSLATETPGVFAGGDVVLGPASLIEAMAHGHQAAASIHAYLCHEPLPISSRTETPYAPNPRPGAPAQPKTPMRRVSEQDRIRDFREIDLGYTPEEAMAEAGRCLACGLCSECGLCVKACSPGAIVHDMQPTTETLSVGSIILTPGYDEFQAAARPEFGHGRYANVLSSVQFERMLSASGPTEGRVLRPSDGKPVHKLGFIQCVGSRDAARGNGYCSSICCMSATKEAMVALEHVPDLEVSIFCMDVRAFGKEFDQYVERAKREHGVKFVHAMPSRLVEMPGSRSLRVRYFDPGANELAEDFDLVVLSVGQRPSQWVKLTAERLGLRLNQFGFCDTDRLAPLAASTPGVFVAGAFQEPKDIPESVAQASAAAACAMAELAPVRGTQLVRHEYPWERDVTDEPARVGVFICHCGHNIAGVVDVQAVASAARRLPGVVHSETNLYACSDTSQAHIQQVVREARLNRLVVASCSPRTHEVLFQETLREAGLNQYLFAMTNIRDQCSWVHRNEPAAATEKAMDLMRMAVGRARQLRALPTGRLPVTQSALVVGGGLGGMTAALTLADQGFEVHLVEKEPVLGGQLRHLRFTLEGADVPSFLGELVDRVERHPKISLELSARLAEVAGHAGNFRTRVEARGSEKTILHGAIIVATGGHERPTEQYRYGRHRRVVTQRELETKLAQGHLPKTLGENPTIVMIQCVGSRDEHHPYCSRVCCSEAVKNALRIKELAPAARVVVLHSEMRTYGFRELYYQKAREAGVLFIRHPEDRRPELGKSKKLRVRVTDRGTGRELELRPELLVLSTGIAPAEDNPALSGLLRTALTADGFFLEAHPKLRPVDFANEGEYLCGLAHSPRFMDETIAQAKAAAGRAATILSRTHLEIAGQIAHVDPKNCVACATCVKVCPYGAPLLNQLNKAEIQAAKCMGCGSCVAACPARTISLRHQEDSQISAMLDELVTAAGGAE